MASTFFHFAPFASSIRGSFLTQNKVKLHCKRLHAYATYLFPSCHIHTHINTKTVSIIRKKVSLRHLIISCTTQIRQRGRHTHTHTQAPPQTVQSTSFNGASGGQEPLSALNHSFNPIPTAQDSAMAGTVVLTGQGLWMRRNDFINKRLFFRLW